MFEACRFCICDKEDHISQYVILNSQDGKTSFLLILLLDFGLFFEDQVSMNWECSFDITDAAVF